MKSKQRKFLYISDDNCDKIEKAQEKYSTTFTGAINVLLTKVQDND